MAEDFRVATDFADHHKIKKLIRKFGENSFRCWVRFLGYVRSNRPNGRLTNMEPIDIAEAAGWNGDSNEFVSILVDYKLLDQLNNGLCRVHDWEKFNPYSVDAEKRRRHAQEAARARWAKGDNKIGGCLEHNRAMPEHKLGNAPHVPSRPLTNDTSQTHKNNILAGKPPYEHIRNLYIEICTDLPKPTGITTWSQKRIGQINARWKEHPDLDWWREYFNKIAASDFLKNGNDSWKGADFGWVILPSNMEKILEGRYDNKEKKRALLTSEKDYGPPGERQF